MHCGSWVTSLTSSPAFFACWTSRDLEASQPTPLIQFRSDLYWFCRWTHSRFSFNQQVLSLNKTSCNLKSNSETYVALQLVGLLSPGDVHVRWQSRILMEEGLVFGVSCQVLSLLGVADVQHVQINTGDRIHFTRQMTKFIQTWHQNFVLLCIIPTENIYISASLHRSVF